jgi:hypothetical protein
MKEAEEVSFKMVRLYKDNFGNIRTYQRDNQHYPLYAVLINGSYYYVGECHEDELWLSE